MSFVEAPETQHDRLVALHQLIMRGIPCILWAEDALAYGHGVPTGLFDQQILVPDELLDAAAAVLEEGKYKRTSELNENYIVRAGPYEGVYGFPRSVRLEHLDIPKVAPYKLYPLPRYILLLPQSYFALDTRSASRFKSLVPPLDLSNADILVAKYNTLLEGLVNFIMHPPTGHQDTSRFYIIFIGYLTHYRRRGLRNRDIISRLRRRIVRGI